MKLARRWFWTFAALALGLLPIVVWLAGGVWWASEPVLAGGGVEFSLSASKEGTVTLGDYITYTMVYTVPPGTTMTTVTLKSCLPNNNPSATEPEFRYVSGSWEGPRAIGDTPPVSDVVPTGDHYCRTWALPAVSNTSGESYEYYVRYLAQVYERYDNSQRGQLGITDAELAWGNANVLTSTWALSITTPNMSTHFYLEDPNGVRHYSGSSIGSLTAGDSLTLTAIFTNVPGVNVQSAYSAVVHMYMPDFITYATSLGDTPPPQLYPLVYLSRGYLGIRWFAPGVFAEGPGADARLGDIAPGDALIYQVRFEVLEDVGPSLSSNAAGFAFNSTSSVSWNSRFKTVPQSNTFYGRFVTGPVPSIALSTVQITMTRSVAGGFLESSHIFAGPKDVITYTSSYTLPPGTTLGAPAYFYDRLPDGLVYGGVVTYPMEIVTGTPQLVVIKEGTSGWATFVRWYLTETLSVAQAVGYTFVYTAYPESNFFLDTGAEIPWAYEFRRDIGVTYTFLGRERSSKGPADSRTVAFSRPHYGDYRDDTLGRVKLSKCLIWEDDCLEARTANRALPIQGGSIIVFELNYMCNGGFGTGTKHAPATLTAYNTIITDTLPALFEVVDAWPPDYHVTVSGNQQSVTWYENDSVPPKYCLPGVDAATDKLNSPAYVITATVPLSAEVGVGYVNRIDLEYQDVIGSLYQDQFVELFMVVKLNVDKWPEGVRGTPDVRIGEVMTYTVVDTVPPRGIAYWPMQGDLLPPGVYYIPNTFQIEGAALVGTEFMTSVVLSPLGTPQEKLTWWMNTLDNQAADSSLRVTMTYQVRVTGLYADDVPFANTISQMETDTRLRSDTRMHWNITNRQGAPYDQSTTEPVYGTAYLHQPCFNIDVPNRDYYKKVLTTTSGTHFVNAGDYVSYYLYIRNTGLGDAHEVLISDTLPAGLEFIEYSAAIYDTAKTPYTVTMYQEPQPGERDLVWEVALIPRRPGGYPVLSWGSLALTYTARVTDVVGAGVTLSNALRVMDFSSMPGSSPYERHYNDLYADIVKYAGPLTVTSAVLQKDVPAGGVRLQPLVYTLTAPSPTIKASLHNVIITDVLDASLEPVAAVASSSVSGLSYGFAGQVFTATVPFLDHYEQFSIVLTTTIRPTATSEIPNRATLSWTNQPEGGERFEVEAVNSTLVLDPDLMVTKSSLTPVSPGSEYTYTLTYQNAGTAIARHVVLTDVFPTEVDYVGYYAESRLVTQTSSSPLVWELGDLAPGEGDNLYLTATVAMTKPVGTLAVNEAEISTISLGDMPENNHTLFTTLITKTTDIVISQHPLTTVVVPGQEVSYTLHYTVTGIEVAQGVEIADVYPPEFIFVTADPMPTGAPTDGRALWELGTLPTDTVGSVQVTFQVTAPLTNGLRLTNTAVIDAINARPLAVSRPVTVSSAPALLVTKRASEDKVKPGDELIYTIVYTNAGTDYAHGVWLTETYGAYINVESIWPVPDVGNNSWDLGTLGQVTGTVVITGHVLSGAPFPYVSTNHVTLDAQNSSAVQDTSDTLISDNLLQVSVSAPPTVTPGDQIVYTLIYTAAGSEPSFGVVLRNTLPDHVTVDAAHPLYTLKAGSEVRWLLGDLAYGTANTVTITATVSAPLQDGLALHNTARMEAEDTAPAEQTVTSIVNSESALALDKTASAGVVKPGELLVYTITYTNTGSDYAYNAVIHENYGQYVDLISAVPMPSSGEDTWLLGDLGQLSGTIVITMAVDEAAPIPFDIVNQVTLSADNATTLAAEAITQISDNFLALALTAPELVGAGDVLTYTLVYTAGGTQPSHDVTLRNVLPAHVTLEATHPPTDAVDGDTLIWQFGNLSEGTTDTLTITVRVTQPLTDGTQLLNTATITALDTLAAQQMATTTVSSAPVLLLDKVASSSKVSPDSTLVYTITYANTGNEMAHAVVITETYGDYIDFVAASPPPDEGDNVWRIGSLGQVGGSIVITTHVNSAAPFPSTTLNRVDLTAANAGDLSATVETIISKNLVELSATAPPVVDAGAVLTYTLIYTASGTEDSLDAVLRSDPTAHGVVEGALPPYDQSAGDTLIWNLGHLPLGVTGTVQVGVRITSPLTDGLALLNSGVITAQATYPAFASVTSTARSTPVLQLAKEAATEHIPPGGTQVYTVTYANTGNGYAHGVVITETYGDYVSFGAASPPPDVGDNVWQIGRLGDVPGVLVITTTVSEATPYLSWLTNRVTMTADGGFSDSATVETQVIEGVLALTRQAPPVVDAGGWLTYTLFYTATGIRASESVVLTESYPLDATFVSATPAPDAGDSTWNLGTLSPGTFGSVQVTLRVTAPLTDGHVLVSTAGITAVNALPAVAPGAVVVRSAPELLLSMAASRDEFVPGEGLIYTVTYANVGNDYARDVTLVLTYDTALNFAGAAPPPDTGNHTWIWSRLGLESGEIVITTTVPAGAEPSSAIVTRGVLDASNADLAEAAVTVQGGEQRIFLPLVLKQHAGSTHKMYLAYSR